jgi:hypothetical protein
MHWRGLYPLWVSYWVISFLSSSILFAIAALVANAFDPNLGYYIPLATFATLASIWVCTLSIGIWQGVGVWRSANNYAARRSSIGRKAPWAVAAKIGLSFSVIRLAATFLSSGLPQLSETTRIAFMGDPDIPTYSLQTLRSGTEAEITGGIKFGLTDDLDKLLKASPQVKVVHLNSPGGRMGEGEKLYNLIREKGLTTYVQAQCISACTIAFAGGRERYIAQGAVLGYHQGAFAGLLSSKELQDLVDGEARIYRDAGLSTDFIGRAVTTPNSEVWTPSVAELFAANVITGVSEEGQFADTGVQAGMQTGSRAASTYAAQEIESAQEHATANRSASDILQERSSTAVAAILNSAKTADEKYFAASNLFFGAYFLNTRTRAEYCTARGVDIGRFVAAYEQINRDVFVSAEKYQIEDFKGHGYAYDIDKFYEMMSPALKKYVAQDMSDLARTSKASETEVCESLEEDSASWAEALDYRKLAPDIAQVLLRK